MSFSTSVWSTFPLLGHDAPDLHGGWYNNHRGQVMGSSVVSAASLGGTDRPIRLMIIPRINWRGIALPPSSTQSTQQVFNS